jgi:hypothetical protein
MSHNSDPGVNYTCTFNAWNIINKRAWIAQFICFESQNWDFGFSSRSQGPGPGLENLRFAPVPDSWVTENQIFLALPS